VYPQEKGAFQLSLMPWITSYEGQRTGGTPLVIEYGLTDAWQAEVEWGGVGYGTPDEGAAVEFGMRYGRMNVLGKRLHMALRSALEVPLEHDEDPEAEATLILATDIPRLADLHLFMQGVAVVELGEAEEVVPESEQGKSGWRWNIGAVVPGRRLHLTAEGNIFQTEEDTHIYATAGVVWDLPGEWQVGLGVPVGLTEASEPVRLITMLTFEIELFDSEC